MILKLPLIFYFDSQKFEKKMIYLQYFSVKFFQIIADYTGKSSFPESLMKASVSFVRLRLFMFI